MINFSKKIEHELQTHLTKGEPPDESPFVQMDGQIYLRYDQIQVELVERGLKVSMWWRNERTYEMPVLDPGIAIGTSVVLLGIEGYMAIQLTP